MHYYVTNYLHTVTFVGVTATQWNIVVHHGGLPLLEFYTNRCINKIALVELSPKDISFVAWRYMVHTIIACVVVLYTGTIIAYVVLHTGTIIACIVVLHTGTIIACIVVLHTDLYNYSMCCSVTYRPV